MERLERALPVTTETAAGELTTVPAALETTTL
jgi:hypothetical protein